MSRCPRRHMVKLKGLERLLVAKSRQAVRRSIQLSVSVHDRVEHVEPTLAGGRIMNRPVGLGPAAR
jgi:hypothetical protein